MKTQFSLFRIPKLILIFMLIGVIFVFGCYVVFQSNYLAQRMWEVLDQFGHTHVFMIDVMDAYVKEQLPFEKGGLGYQFVEKMLVSYAYFVTPVEDPFGLNDDRSIAGPVFDDATTKRLQEMYEERYGDRKAHQIEEDRHSANPAPK